MFCLFNITVMLVLFFFALTAASLFSLCTLFHLFIIFLICVIWLIHTHCDVQRITASLYTCWYSTNKTGTCSSKHCFHSVSGGQIFHRIPLTSINAYCRVRKLQSQKQFLSLNVGNKKSNEVKTYCGLFCDLTAV